MEQASDAPNPTLPSVTSNEVVTAQDLLTEADSILAMPQALLPANGYDDPLQHSNFISSTMASSGDPQSITAGKPDTGIIFYPKLMCLVLRRDCPL